MDYQYENLGDERFQELCSCIISKEFPNIQAFPVGQPDGGRDTIVYELLGGVKKSFIVFQVKFVRNADQDRDLHKWLLQTIDGEAPKIDELIPRGATSYYLLTNVRGTAHLDSGSKDQLNAILEAKISIPAICWWRDDLSRLFEKDVMLKWSFPEILNGQDVLNSLLFDHFTENKEKRSAVLRAYLTDQFEIDSEVKFKQIDLQNKLLSLFTDVPLRVKKIDTKNRALRKTLNQIFNDSIDDTEEHVRHEETACLGAADFILHSKTQDEVGKILLEGGPGQGKSTITQYVCQVHRIKLLRKIHDLSLLPQSIISAKVRIPLKIDLRDIAAWVEHKNPYQNILPAEYFEKTWRNSLESYLICHIFYHSKLEDFSYTDLIAVGQHSPLLFVFDGFDEIADINLRREVIDFVHKGILRLSANAKSIQVVVTSRPAAFSDAVVFSVNNYPHFELTNITPSIINEYVGKWIKASRLQNRDANELKRLVNDKLQMPHLKELAKSPMQLAIFISLLRTKGQSLPNKRTALFDSYINLFFDRESEKSSLVRDKRDLITDIHQYLAWLLHSEAERYKNSGSISLEDLRKRLREYLINEGHDPSIAEQLFDVMKERVCALVSRVQGTFEFEVQPLREYFCAKYLYTSAQNSTAGSVKPGTKPERLHAILRNPYWQNVVRFFTGCADAGELDMIIQELKDLQTDELLKYTHYPRIITSQILSDYVFTQKPKKMAEVVGLIINGINIGNIINESERATNSERIMLPNECGRAEIVNECFKQLAKLPRNDYAAELIGIINNNPMNNLEKWAELLPGLTDENDVTKWFEFAYRLQLIHRMDELTLKSMIRDVSNENLARRIQILIDGKREVILNEFPLLKGIAIQLIVDHQVSTLPRGKAITALGFLSTIFNPYILRLTFQRGEAGRSLIKFIDELLGSNHSLYTSALKVEDLADQTIADFSLSVASFLTCDLASLQSSLLEWDSFVEKSRCAFGENLNFDIISVVASSVNEKSITYTEFENLGDSSKSLCKRARCARLKSGTISFWRENLLNSENRLFIILSFFTWATPRAIIQMAAEIIPMIESLFSSDYIKLVKGLSITSELAPFSDQNQRIIIDTIDTYSDADRTKYLLSLRFKNGNGAKYTYESLAPSFFASNGVANTQLNYLLLLFLTDPTSAKVLAEIKSAYNSDTSNVSDRYFYLGHITNTEAIPYTMAKDVMTNCREYPRAIGALAESECRAHANTDLKPIGEIAETARWFE